MPGRTYGVECRLAGDFGARLALLFPWVWPCDVSAFLADLGSELLEGPHHVAGPHLSGCFCPPCGDSRINRVPQWTRVSARPWAWTISDLQVPPCSPQLGH